MKDPAAITQLRCASECLEFRQSYDHHDSDQQQREVLDYRSGLWSHLPEQVMERILAFLPLPSFFRFRSVCKRWNSLMYSSRFLEICSQIGGTTTTRPWFLMLKEPAITLTSEGWLYNPCARKWSKLPLTFLPPGARVVATADGILCCSIYSETRVMASRSSCKKLLVCNPLTKTCIELPSTLKERFVPTVGIVVNPETNSYKVMVAGDDMISPFAVKNLTTEVYDSRTNRWRMAATALPRLCNLESGKTVFVQGTFYCMNYNPFSVLAYDIEQEEWTNIQAPMKRFIRTPNLVVCRGRLVLVAAVEKNRLNVPKSIRMWGLQKQQQQHQSSAKNCTSWVELERMPQALYEDFLIRVSSSASSSSSRSCEETSSSQEGVLLFSCVGNGDLILITMQNSPEMLILDLFEKVWRWLPRCPYIIGELLDDIIGHGMVVQGFPFNPRLDALQNRN